MQDSTLQVGEEDFHKPLAIRQARFSEGPTDVSDETNGDRTELIFFVRAEGVDEEREERLEVRVKIGFERGGECPNAEESGFQDR